MKRAIEFSEDVKITHQFIVECKDEDELNTICNFTGTLCEICKQIEDMGVNIIRVNEEYDISSTDDYLEYEDDYWTDFEEEVYVKMSYDEDEDEIEMVATSGEMED